MRVDGRWSALVEAKLEAEVVCVFRDGGGLIFGWVLQIRSRARSGQSLTTMSATKSSTTEGHIDFDYAPVGKPMQTWYRVVGDLASAKKPPLICLHGGPGGIHSYLSPLLDLNSAYDIPVVLYDQAGNGRSTHLQGIDASVLTESLFLAELDNLIARLGIEEYDLLGHSWGGMLAMRAAVRRPKGLRRLAVLSAPTDIHLWVESQSMLRAQLPQKVQDVLAHHEKEGTTTSKEYQEATTVFYRRHLCRIDPYPPDLQAFVQAIEEDPTVYFIMWVHQ